MPKLPFVVALSVTAVLVTGCATTAAEITDPGSTPAVTGASTTGPSRTPSTTRSATAPSTESAAPQGEVATDASSEGTGTPEPPLESPVTEPAAEAGESMVVTPDPEWGTVSISVHQGASFTLTGSDYKPGQVVRISLGIARADSSVMEEQFAEVDAAGGYEFTLTIEPDLEPGTYGILTLIWAGDRPVPNFEETKRFATVEVLPA